jgi:hypothetical protein
MSKIYVHPSLTVARKVVSALEKILPKNIAKNLILKSWSNGREQGLCLKYTKVDSISVLSSKMIVFSEARSSDQILVMAGDASDFDFQTNQPNDEIWEKYRSYFKSGEYSVAARYILNLLLDW